MATLYITEYQTAGNAGFNPMQVPLEPELTTQTVSVSSSAASSSLFNEKTTLIRIHTDISCSFIIGTSPTATTSKGRLAYDQTEYRSVPAGGLYKLSVIQN